MIEEKAILHYNKFKSLRDHFVRDTFTGQLFTVLKSRMIKDDQNDFKVLVQIRNEMTGVESEVDSEYANSHFKEYKA